MVIEGRAGMQFMGDWARGEFVVNGKNPNDDFGCEWVPGSNKGFVFLVNSFATFKSSTAETLEIQDAFLSTLMTPTIQTAFNEIKGSAPARTDTSTKDPCMQRALLQIQQSDEMSALLPSVAHGMAVTERLQQALYEVVHEFMQSESLTPEAAAKKLSRQLRYAHYLIN